MEQKKEKTEKEDSSTKGTSDSMEILKSKSDLAPSVSFIGLFRYADRTDVMYMLMGTLGAVAYGIIQPIIALLLGDVVNSFLEFGALVEKVQKGEIPPSALGPKQDQLEKDVVGVVLQFVYIGIGATIAAYLARGCWTIAGERQAHRVRMKFLDSILKQDVEFFDENEVGDLSTRLSSDTTLYLESISEKFGLAMSYIVTFFTGFIIAFIRGWELTLVLVACFPLLMGAGILVGTAIASGIKGSQSAYARAGAIAQEALSNIRTVYAFNGQKKAMEKFDKYLDDALVLNEKKSLKTGLGFGLFFGLLFGFYALAFFYGAKLAFDGKMQGGDVLNVVFAVIIGAFSLINIGPSLQSMNKGRGVAGKLFQVIESKPMIPSNDPSGEKPEKIRGSIEFKNVSFEYPSRPGVPVLKDFNLKINPGQTVALVGFSGSGKSTIIQLLERFYEPKEGEITVDGLPLPKLNLDHFRSHVGLVSQEPILFDMTIEENIKLGSVDNYDSISLDKIEDVCKASNAHDFIMGLPSKYKTRVGEKGSLLSGGQKQRVAIARALLKNPNILLLDEATSALDTTSEKIVQEALDRASKDRTTIVIAHRLSTIKDADLIVVMDQGDVLETGTHDELIAKDGHYAKLVKAQDLKKEESSGNAGKEDDAPQIEVSQTTNKADEVKVSIAGSEQDFIGAMSEEKKKKMEDLALLKENPTPLLNVLKMQTREVGLLAIGTIGSAVNGSLLPAVGLLLGNVLAAFQKSGQELLDEANFWSLIFFGLMFAQFFANLAQFAGFGIAGERLTRRVRSKMFEAMLKQDLAYFDDPKNGSGSLTAKLSDEADKIQELTGPVLGNILQLMVSCCFALIASFIYSWQMTLVVLAILPILVVSSIFETKVILAATSDPKALKAYSKAAQTACDAIANIRTIKSFSVEQKFVEEYEDNVSIPHRLGIRKGYIGSFGFGVTQGIQFWIYAIAFYVGYRFVFVDQILDPRDLFTVFFTIIFGAISISSAATFGPNITKARVASIGYFKLIDRVPSIIASEDVGEKVIDVQGRTDLEKVKFAYPQRKDQQILKGISFSVQPGQNVALVGPSGSGKSTIVSLLERFYDPDQGTVSIENKSVKDWCLPYLRSKMSIVSQEPTLFSGTIAENIKYGRVDATEEEMINAAKMSNIHDFISKLENGYETEINNTQLSGGQKQRVAIARAMLMKPRLLLLDEATSALDAESEQIVQEALNTASEGRTTITIAHRLSTIQNADLIVVMENGEVIETGNHNDLLQKRGLYYALVQKQKLNKD